ncbi:hypothetical protein GT354_44275, partial [Streptomyces sp. SID3343]|nr:hypothetical protein [Streptomyces sp. SID3343]
MRTHGENDEGSPTERAGRDPSLPAERAGRRRLVIPSLAIVAVLGIAGGAWAVS